MIEHISATIRAKGRIWHTVLSYVEDGKRIEKWKTTGLPLANNKRRAQEIANKRACKFRKLAEEKNRMESWGLDTSVPDMLFSDLMQQWKLRKAPAISKSTLEGYEHILHYADPFFRSRNITVQQVTPALIQRYLDSLQEGRTKPLSGNTIKKHIVLLKSVFNEYIKDGTLVYNPVRRIAPPKIVPYQAQTYSASELNELFEALKGSSIEDIVRVTAFYGLRRSEVCGLRWQDVDFEQNTIYIRYKVLETRINGQSEVMQTNELKTESSRRAFALVPTIRELLLKRRQWTEENRRLWGDCYDHTYDEYIFTLADGSLLTPRAGQRSFSRLHRAARLQENSFSRSAPLLRNATAARGLYPAGNSSVSRSRDLSDDTALCASGCCLENRGIELHGAFAWKW